MCSNACREVGLEFFTFPIAATVCDTNCVPEFASTCVRALPSLYPSDLEMRGTSVCNVPCSSFGGLALH